MSRGFRKGREMENGQKNTPKKKRRALLWTFGVFFAVFAAILIHYRGVRPIVTSEFGSKPKSDDFTSRNAELTVGEEKPSCGWHFLNLKIGGFPTPVLLHVVDTVAPTAEPVDQIVPLGSDLRPDKFIRRIKDADTVRVTFAETPDFRSEWDGTIGIVLEDGSGNRNEVPVAVSVRATVKSLMLEAGCDIPDKDRFLIENVAAEQETAIDESTMHHVGTYPIAFITDSGVRSVSDLIIVDTVSPKADHAFIQLSPGETAEPSDFAPNAKDETDLRFDYVTAPDYDNRDVQKIVVRLIDEGGNTFDVESELFISGVRPRTVEARREPLTPEDFENSDGQTVTVESFVPDTPGTYAIRITVNGVPDTLTVSVVDSTPPSMQKTKIGKTLYTKHAYQPEDFFTAQDLSQVTLSFAEGTDLNAAGEQDITVIARDACGNETSATRSVTLKEDKNPPKIYGVINRICYVGETIAYLSEVFAEDAEDGTVEIAVDSKVEMNKAGTYRVVYRAKDKSGNKTEKACTFTLVKRSVTEQQLREMAKKIMAEITTPDMVDAEKLKAIFNYVQKHIVYANGSNNNYTDWRKAAYDGYMKGTGDCYNIYSLTRALLDETDIQYLSVERVKTHVRRTRHYWVHVNLGTGWYVFDPTWTKKHPVNCFMWTKKQCDSCRLYWYYKASEYPPLATEPFDYDKVVKMEREGLLP